MTDIRFLELVVACVKTIWQHQKTNALVMDVETRKKKLRKLDLKAPSD